MKNCNRTKLSVEMLEERLVPAINVMTDGMGNATITPASNLTSPITFTQTAANTWTIMEGVTPDIVGLVVPGNLTIDFSQSSSNDTVQIDLGGFTMGGSLTAREGPGTDTLLFTGVAGGTISGNLSANNFDTVDTTGGAAVNVGGNVSLTDAAKNTIPTSFTLGSDAIGGNLTITGGNGGVAVNSTTMDSIGGNVYVTVGNGNNSFGMAVSDTVGGSVTYLGGSGGDAVSLPATVGGGVYANLGTASGANSNVFTQGAGGVIGKNLTILSGAVTGTGSASITLNALTGGSAYFNLGIGTRVLNFNATASIFGPSITYSGTGSGTNNINFLGSTSRSSAYFTLGNGSDTFTLGANQSLASLYIDFGVDAPGTHDHFNNAAGSHQPRMTLRNLG